MKKLFFCMAVLLCMVLLCSCAGMTGEAAMDDKLAKIIDENTADHEENGSKVVETIVSSDGLAAQLVALADHENDYLQLYVYDKSGDCFMPMFEPQVMKGEVTAAEDGGFHVDCDSGTYFVGKNESGQWNMHGKGTPFGAGPPKADG